MAIRLSPSALHGADPQILRDIQRAASATSVDFNYLVAQASQESAFQPDAKAATSTATGLYQFTELTWLHEFRLHGAQYGYGDLAQAVTVDEAGREKVLDPEKRKAILDLRTDPALSASLAAELARENRAALERDLGRSVNATDLYLAHFLGAGGASKLIAAVASDGGAKAADLLPAAAAANPSVFYDAGGAARSVADIYRHFAAKMGGGEAVAALGTGGGTSGTAPPPLGSTLSTPVGVASLGIFGGLQTRGPLSQHLLDALTLATLRALSSGDDWSSHPAHGAASSSSSPAQRKDGTSAA
ncbi:MAG TPA: transglycosylase SLT domain-containing protein [Alphaproteobacteria bacterium]|nr:transglycosylase SLT domain-containing protein [Alphaproteobacteria bacterium]